MQLIPYIKTALNPGGTPTRFLHWLSVLLAFQTISSVAPAFWKEPALIWGQVLVFCSAMLIALALWVRKNKWQLALIKIFHFYGMGFCMAVIFLKMGPDSCMMWLLTWTLSLVIAERREYLNSNWVVLIMTFCMLLIGSRFVWNWTTIGDPWPPLLTGVAGCIINAYLLKIDVAGMDNYYKEMRASLSQLEKLSARMTEILTQSGELQYQLWRVSEECIPLLGLEDCVIYLYDEDSKTLIQTAAFGKSKAFDGQIVNAIHITPGEGVVGRCFSEAKEMDVPDTLLFSGYIVDDQPRNSELAVPIMSNGKPVGVIDSEHTKRGFYKDRHKQAFRIIASFCGIKITEHLAHKSLEAAALAQTEADRYRELDELKNRFITNISHDLKTPLSLIKAPATQLARESKDQQTRNLAGYILKNAEHLLKVMNQLLQLNRVDKGLNQLYVNEFDTAKLLNNITAQYEGMISNKNIQFFAEVQSLKLKSDEFRLEQIIHNLLQNAFRYTPKGGGVSLTCHQHDSKLKIVVSDTGPGIPEAFRERVFERFFKVDVNNHEGTGIGLSLVKDYTTALGGSVELNENPGGGSIFQVYIPVDFEPDVDSNHNIQNFEETPADTSANLPVLLIAEDHPDLNNFICNAFENEFRCIQAFDGHEALNKIRETLPDIIVTDLMMPDTDGEALIVRIRADEATAHIPIIVLTAKNRLQSKIDLYNLGVENYLTKPFEIDELRAVIDSLLSQRKRLRELFGQRFLLPVETTINLPESESTEEAGIVRQAIQWVLENLEKDSIGVSDLTADLNMGRNRLQREIKAATGLTPVEFIRSVRLHEAKKMLASRNYHVSEAAYACGFNNLSYFTRRFKSEFGVLPSEFVEKSSVI
jgi:signal transduction histidine kinase/DNA-binding response OmpR family regulator